MPDVEVKVSAPDVAPAAVTHAPKPDPTAEHLTPATDRRIHGVVGEARRVANTVFLFFFNPLLDSETNRLSGTKLMALGMFTVDCYDVLQSHRLAELAFTKGAVDAIDVHNIELFGLSVLTWFGKLGLDTTVALVKAWRGKET